MLKVPHLLDEVENEKLRCHNFNSTLVRPKLKSIFQIADTSLLPSRTVPATNAKVHTLKRNTTAAETLEPTDTD